uniref:Uncharacterized protein n=1 Tax=Picea glauca TaxID=3330 RepID=A0A117NIZ5_PICGL|nr:hypothetical protein ABT39_MTgene537 [Picea glauca]QHR89406.1 hypothetical protein Q903MT_gene3427 [Picea sitchensis]
MDRSVSMYGSLSLHIDICIWMWISKSRYACMERKRSILPIYGCLDMMDMHIYIYRFLTCHSAMRIPYGKCLRHEESTTR